MVLHRKHQVPFKVLSFFISFLIFLQQCTWASEMDLFSHEASAQFPETGFHEQDLKSRVHDQNAWVEQKNLVDETASELRSGYLEENFESLQLKIPGSYSFELFKNSLKIIETDEGDLISDIVLNEDGSLERGKVLLNSGEEFWVENGSVTSYKGQNNVRYFFDEKMR